MLLVVAEAFMLVFALSTDAFVSGFAYGTNKIKIPFASVAVINVICSSVLAVALLFGAFLSPLIPSAVTNAVCFTILFIIGNVKLFDSAVKALIRKHGGINKRIKFSVFSLGVILNIYANPQDADADASKLLSPKEAAYLAAALSLDGLAIGFGAGLANINPLLVIALSLVSDMAAVTGGCCLGNKIARKLSLNLTWLSGVILIALAFLKIF